MSFTEETANEAYDAQAAHGDRSEKGPIHGSQLKEFFKKWLEEYPDPYPQRYRKNIPFTWVKKKGMLLMTLTDGEVTYPEPVQTLEAQI